MSVVQNEEFGPVLTMQTFQPRRKRRHGQRHRIWPQRERFSANVDVAMRAALAVEACSVWVDDWARLHDQFEDGGFKASGVGRMRDLAVIDDFIEFKHIRLHPEDSQAAGAS
jgi:betaine-aldehyde dehydrogenase